MQKYNIFAKHKTNSHKKLSKSEHFLSSQALNAIGVAALSRS